jgi:hypothetical protein
MGCHKCQFVVQGFNLAECILITSETINQDMKNLMEDFKSINQKNQTTQDYIQSLINKPIFKIHEIQDLKKLL